MTPALLTNEPRRRTAAFLVGLSPLLLGFVLDDVVAPHLIWGTFDVPPVHLFLAVIGMAMLGEKLFLGVE